jgi:hypothetical protein
MFGLGNKRRRARNDAFGRGKLGTAAMAGIGMLAWKWWRNRQAGGRQTSSPDNTYTPSSTSTAERF